MKSQVLHTVWCNISGESAGEIWNWSLSGVKGLKYGRNQCRCQLTRVRSLVTNEQRLRATSELVRCESSVWYVKHASIAESSQRRWRGGWITRPFDEADQSRFLGTCLPSPGLGFGFGRGWVRVRVSSEEGVGGYVPRNLDWSDWANRLNSNDNYNNDLYSAVYNSLINGALKESKVDCCREKAWCMTRPVSGTACPTRTGGSQTPVWSCTKPSLGNRLDCCTKWRL